MVCCDKGKGFTGNAVLLASRSLNISLSVVAANESSKLNYRDVVRPLVSGVDSAFIGTRSSELATNMWNTFFDE